MATEIDFEISAVSHQAHIFHVRCTLTNPRAGELVFSLPSWTPGSYLIRDYAQHVTSISATVALRKLDKDTWCCEPGGADLVIDYDVYAFDPSVRAAFLDDSYAFFTGTGVFIRLHGFELNRHRVKIVEPSFVSRVATSMPIEKADTRGFGTYLCANYDELVDHPVMISDFDCLNFHVGDVLHEIVVYPKLEFDKERLILDCQKLCQAHIDTFGTPAPFENYKFLIRAEEGGYGGLEHRASSALLCKISDLPQKHHTKMSDGYKGLLGLISHEYFHAWNIKRLKPIPFLNYDYNRENYTNLLWFFEGFTSYYDDLLLVRSGVIDWKSYLELVAKTISRVQGEAGRFNQTLAAASFDSWIKFYKPNENSPNVNVSYYLKGSLVGLALDLTIRLLTSHKNSLDDLMRVLWTKYALNGEGISEEIIRQEASTIAGGSLDAFFNAYIHGTEDPPLAELFESVGVVVDFNSTSPNGTPTLGCNFKAEGDLSISHVPLGSNAMQGGLCVGDVVISLGGLRVHQNNLDAVLASYAPGQQVQLHLFRRSWLKEVAITLVEPPKTKCVLRVREKMGEEAEAALKAWLG